MLQFLTIVKTIIAILPILRDLIAASEAFFPAQGSGVQKLELVRVLLQNTYDTAHKFDAPFSSVWPVLSKLIGFAVPNVTEKAAVNPDVARAKVAFKALEAAVTPIATPVSATLVIQKDIGVRLATPDA